MNVFTDPSPVPEILHSGLWDPNASRGNTGTAGQFRESYHKGYGIDDGDRYGQVMPQLINLMQAVEDARTLQARPASRPHPGRPASGNPFCSMAIGVGVVMRLHSMLVAALTTYVGSVAGFGGTPGDLVHRNPA
jgi:hypothetical protein